MSRRSSFGWWHWKLPWRPLPSAASRCSLRPPSARTSTRRRFIDRVGERRSNRQSFLLRQPALRTGRPLADAGQSKDHPVLRLGSPTLSDQVAHLSGPDPDPIFFGLPVLPQPGPSPPKRWPWPSTGPSSLSRTARLSFPIMQTPRRANSSHALPAGIPRRRPRQLSRFLPRIQRTGGRDPGHRVRELKP